MISDIPVPTETTRRRFLRATAAAGTLVGVGGLAGAQSQSNSFRLDGEIGGWTGRAPDAIAGKTNPTLSLDAGTTYRITWKNVDGQPHNIALLDSDGNTLKRTENISEKGATQTIEFTASEEMAEYICEVHPTSMRGSLSFGSKTTTTTPESEGESERFMPKGATVRTETIADGDLTAPLDFGVPPGGSRKFIVDRFGQVYIHNADGLRDEPFIDVSDKLTEVTGEMGLLGMTFHPNFQQNRKFYLRYSAPPREGTPDDFDHTEVLAEFTASDDGSTGNLDSERTILEIPSPYDTHNSGAITFGSDGYLYMGMGDGGGGHDVGKGHVDDWYDRFEENHAEGGNGQDVSANLLGSVLRIDVNSQEDDKAYAIPDDNPLVGKEGLDEHFAWGFRNPWRMGFSNGSLFVADVGQNGYEEVSIVEKGGNYGWNVREGTHCFKPGPEGSRNPPEECPTKTPPDVRGGEPLIDPVIEYPHSYEDSGVGSAVIGGYTYQNSAIPQINGKYVFGDYRKTSETETPTGSLFAATPTEEGLWDLEELRIENTDNGLLGGYVLAIGRDNGGGLYVLTTENPGGDATGAVHRIRPPKNAQRTTTGNATAGTTNTTATANTTAAGNTTATNATTTTANTTATTTANSTTATAGNATADATPTANATTGTAQSSGTPKATETATQTATDSTNETAGEGGVSAGTSGGSGPGFGVVAALGGLAVGAARLLAGRDD
jgi:glucose/arabinose dehydrogenase